MTFLWIAIRCLTSLPLPEANIYQALFLQSMADVYVKLAEKCKRSNTSRYPSNPRVLPITPAGTSEDWYMGDVSILLILVR